MKRTVSYTDARGERHHSPEAATVSDIAALFITDKMPAGAAKAIATTVLANRKDIERIFAEHDEATQPEL